MNCISYYVYKIVEKLFVKAKKAKAFKTAYGLKNINMSMCISAPEITGKEVVKIPADELYLGYDYLKDNYTLLNIPIKESPHYDLMRCMYEGVDISECDYIKRWLSGTLDWRYGYKKPKNYSFFINRFKESRENIQKNKIKPVIVYRLNGRYYIYDGKHRAAMYAYNNILVPCVIIDEEPVFSGIWADMFDFIKHIKAYSKHKALYDEFTLREVQ